MHRMLWLCYGSSASVSLRVSRSAFFNKVVTFFRTLHVKGVSLQDVVNVLGNNKLETVQKLFLSGIHLSKAIQARQRLSLAAQAHIGANVVSPLAILNRWKAVQSNVGLNILSFEMRARGLRYTWRPLSFISTR